MKKYLLFAVAFFLVSAISLMSEEIIVGQKPPCGGDEIEWGEPQFAVFQKNNCYYLVEFYYKEYHGWRSFIQITGFYSLSDGAECDVYEDFRQDVYPWLWDVVIDVDDSDNDEWILEEAPCHEIQYRRDEDPIDLVIPPNLVGKIGVLPPEINYTTDENGNIIISNIGYILPCIQNTCCKMGHKILVINSQLQSVRYMNLPFEQPECENPVKCKPSCNKLKITWDRSGLQFPTGINNNEYNKNKLIFPNPSSNKFNLVINTSSNGKGEILIFDVKGTIIKSQNFDKSNQVIKEVIDLGDKESGNYYYVVKINSLIVDYGILSLIK